MGLIDTNVGLSLWSTERDWMEDRAVSCRNQYVHPCCSCGLEFVSKEGRVQCKPCHDNKEPWPSNAELLAQAKV